MPPFSSIWPWVIGLGLAYCGWFCLFKTDVMVARNRKNYEKFKAVQSLPSSSLVLKSSYPTYIRAAGIFIWVCDLVILYEVIFRHLR